MCRVPPRPLTAAQTAARPCCRRVPALHSAWAGRSGGMGEGKACGAHWRGPQRHVGPCSCPAPLALPHLPILAAESGGAQGSELA